MAPKEFNDFMVLQQLRSSSVFAYVDLVRYGFPIRIPIDQLQNLYAPHIRGDTKQFLTKLLLSNGYRIGEFKIGNSQVLFRSTNDTDRLFSVQSCIPAFQRFRARTRWLILLYFVMNLLRKRKEFDNQAKHTHDTPLKTTVSIKRKIISPPLDTVRQHLNVQTPPTECEGTKQRLPHESAVKTPSMNVRRPPTSERKKTEKRPPHESRYDCSNHWPEMHGSTRCKKEGCTFKTHFRCSKCNVSLCITADRNCFKAFHILKTTK